ncbi:MAG: hydroxymethylglutaryl-CoA lyase, partial [Rhodospirillaceae bacterium]
MARPTRVEITEVGPRDGLQAEPKFVPTELKIKLINDLVDAGVKRMEFSSFVSPRAVPQLA